jgi:hypothetical protein
MQAALITLGSLYALWVFYLAVMNLQRAHVADNLGPVAFGLGLPLVAVAFLLDVLINVTLGSLLLCERPREFTLSVRLTRHIVEGSGWRRRVAVWIMRYLLEPFDTTGAHRAL